MADLRQDRLGHPRASRRPGLADLRPAHDLHLLEPRYSTGIPVEADTLDDLAAKLGIAAGPRPRRSAAFNAASHAGRGPAAAASGFDPFHKDGLATAAGCGPPKSNWALPLDAPPFVAYAVTCGITFTYGGLKIDTAARVLDTDRPADAGPVRHRRDRRRLLLPQLRRRLGPDAGRHVRAHRRPGGGAAGAGPGGRHEPAAGRRGELAVVFMRGGTSKGVFCRLDDLPPAPAPTVRLLLALMGSPDPMQLDGLGGTHSSTSKVVAVGPGRSPASTSSTSSPRSAWTGRWSTSPATAAT